MGKPMSQAQRRKLSKVMKARWAAAKKQTGAKGGNRVESFAKLHIREVTIAPNKLVVVVGRADTFKRVYRVTAEGRMLETDCTIVKT